MPRTHVYFETDVYALFYIFFRLWRVFFIFFQIVSCFFYIFSDCGSFFFIFPDCVVFFLCFWSVFSENRAIFQKKYSSADYMSLRKLPPLFLPYRVDVWWCFFASGGKKKDLSAETGPLFVSQLSATYGASSPRLLHTPHDLFAAWITRTLEVIHPVALVDVCFERPP